MNVRTIQFFYYIKVEFIPLFFDKFEFIPTLYETRILTSNLRTFLAHSLVDSPSTRKMKVGHGANVESLTSTRIGYGQFYLYKTWVMLLLQVDFVELC